MKPTILLIEDDPMTSRLVELTLTHAGYQVVLVSDGPRGIEMAQADPPDLILLDLMLPGPDGFAVLTQLRAEPRTADVPVVVISSKSQLADKQIASTIGASAYLTKPYKRSELLQTISSLLSEKLE
ncbi:MAG: hypothetical protein B6I35_03040 [Anaerolineaceae bacterium 4572_32.2]|nr:MAG: hypothetical protein B6I35_03040 [Anaerolineaceae bacterium 4572_32.2]